MISVDNELLEKIVANVLAQLQTHPTVHAPQSPAVPKPDPSVVELDLPVITAEVLADRVQPGQLVRIGRRSILTPSARDWLAHRKIGCARCHAPTPANSARWLGMVTFVTPAVATLRQSETTWKAELLGTSREAAEYAVRVLCTGEADGVLGLCHAAETVTCLANRHPKVRAAVLATLGDLQEIVQHLGPNLLVVDPRSKSFGELRNMVRTVSALGQPKDPLSV